MNMTKILVIEDERSMRESIVEVLGYEGFETISATNGRTGVQLAKEHTPDLILCDILMPGLNGYDALTELRHDPVTATIPFIFLTSKTEWKDVRQGMQLGADDYLTKPFDIDELLSAIRSRLEKQAAVSKQLEDLRLNLSMLLPHELRTPLNVIIGASSHLISLGLKQLPEPDKIIEMQAAIYESALRLQRLIENYLLYTKLRLMEYEPKKRMVKQWQSNNVVYIENIIPSLARYKAEKVERKDDLVLELVDDKIRVSAESLQKIVAELLDNAFKFSNAGTPVRVTGKIDGNRYILSIIDLGRGMTAEQIACIGAYMQFEREWYEQQGSGLGLIISRLLIQLDGGKLTIESQVNQGTTVNVMFNRKS
jgi:CheY-like chemotaxis protein/anti-sigma regulatory factor (Ser/Thr protein kinase)